VYRETYQKHVKGCAISLGISIVLIIANLYMELFEHEALSTFPWPQEIWYHNMWTVLLPSYSNMNWIVSLTISTYGTHMSSSPLNQKPTESYIFWTPVYRSKEMGQLRSPFKGSLLTQIYIVTFS